MKPLRTRLNTARSIGTHESRGFPLNTPANKNKAKYNSKEKQKRRIDLKKEWTIEPFPENRGP